MRAVRRHAKPPVLGNVGENMALLRKGQLRCLGVAAPARLPQAAEVPTSREQGFELVCGASRGLVGPPGMPAPVRARLGAALAAAPSDPAFLQEVQRLGMPLRPLLGEEYRRMLAEMDASLHALWAAALARRVAAEASPSAERRRGRAFGTGSSAMCRKGHVVPQCSHSHRRASGCPARGGAARPARE